MIPLGTVWDNGVTFWQSFIPKMTGISQEIGYIWPIPSGEVAWFHRVQSRNPDFDDFRMSRDFRPLTLCQTVQRQRVVTHCWLRECRFSPLLSFSRVRLTLLPLSLSTSHTACGSHFLYMYSLPVLPCTVHLWSGQHCVCLSGDLEPKPDKYMKPS